MANENTSEEVGGAMPASPPRENLYRALPGIKFERAESGAPILTGHFAVWDQWTEIRSAYEGNFLERFSPSAMTKTLRENTPKVLFQHGRDPQIGDKPLGTPTRVEPDSTGAFYEVEMFDTSYNRDLLPGLEAGAYGASFRFSVVREDVVQRPKKSDYNPRGIPERTVQEARVAEFGPVTFPAYANATAGIRSMTDEFLFDALVEDPGRLKDLCRRAGISLAGVDNPLATTTNSAGGVTINVTTSGDVARFQNGWRNVEPENEVVEQGDEEIHRADEEPDASERTTPTEPEPSEATTQTPSRGLFWLADPPEHLKG